MPPPQPTTVHVHHQLLHPVSLLFLFSSFPFTIICIQSAFTDNTTSMHQALTQVSFFFCSFSVYAHPHLHPMHLCAHVHQPSTSQQHICIHASTGSSKFFLFSFLSACPFTSITGPHAHTTCAPVCPCLLTIYISNNTSASMHPLAQVSFFFCLF